MNRNAAEETKVITLARGEAAPKTLRELGLPGELASSLEAAFRMLGHTRGDRIVGYTFVDAKGGRHAIRAEAPQAPVVRAA